MQTGPVWTHKANAQQVFNDRWLGEAQFAFVGGGFALDFPDPETQFGIQRYYDEVTEEYRRSFSQSLFDRPLYLFDTKTTYFLPNVLGGDHAFKAGYSYRFAPVSSYSHVGGFVEARFRSGVPTNASMYRDSYTESEQNTHSFFVQDEYQAGRFSVRMGVRLDRYDSRALASSVEANPIIPDLLPAASFGGADPNVVWNSFSPRLGVNYDLFGSGKTVLGLTLSRYYGQPGVDSLAATLNPLGTVHLRYPWTDLNNDQLVTRNELNLSAAPVITGNYNPSAPGSPTTINTVDPNIKNEKTDEIVIGLQHELLPGIALSANYIYRKYGNFRWTTDEGVTSASYAEVIGNPAACYTGPGVTGPCPAFSYFAPTINIGGRKKTLTNRPDYNREYNGFEVSMTKRYSNSGTRTSASPTTARSITMKRRASYIDPTNINVLNGCAVGVGVGRQRRVGRVGQREVGGARHGDLHAARQLRGLGLPERPTGLHLPVRLHDGRARQRRRGDHRRDRTLRRRAPAELLAVRHEGGAPDHAEPLHVPSAGDVLQPGEQQRAARLSAQHRRGELQGNPADSLAARRAGRPSRRLLVIRGFGSEGGE